MLHRKAAACLAIVALPLIAGVLSAQAESHKAPKDLKIVMVDVEGGAAVLFVTPEHKSLLIDTGWAPDVGGPRQAAGAPPPPSSADLIYAAAQSLGVTKIDYLLMTHYHADHVGGVDALLAKLPADTFIDHGPNREQPPPNATPGELAFATATLYPKWVAAYQGHRHITAHVGQKLNIGSLHIEFVAGDGNILSSPLPGAGEINPLCNGVQPMARDGGEENVRSLGMVLTFGKTRILDLGDLSWNREIQLLCPTNKVGKMDVYIVTGHGMDLSSSPPTGALDPLVALMQNGPRKGGDASVIRTVDSYPALQGFWREHYSVRYPDLNGDPNYIANLNEQPDHGYSISVDITPSGKITVTNDRNQFSKVYHSRGE